MIIAFLNIFYSILVATSILFLGYSSQSISKVTAKSVFFLLLDKWFIAGLILAFAARMLFVVIMHQVSQDSRWIHAPVSITTLITILAIVFGLIANRIFLNESLNAQQLLGAGIIICGIFLLYR